MSQSLASVKVHLIFSTKSRQPFLTREIRSECYSYLAMVARIQDSYVYETGGMEDHVHLLVTLSRTIALSKMVERMKTSSSKWLKTKSGNLATFSWQNGYGAFSVSASQVEAVRYYIRNQENHHRRMTFQDEYRALLRSSDLAFDETYLWD